MRTPGVSDAHCGRAGRRMLQSLGLVALCGFTPLPPQTVGAPAAAYELRRRDIVVSEFSWVEGADSTILPRPVKAVYAGTVTATAVVKAGTVDTIMFATGPFTVLRVTDPNGRQLSYTAGKEAIVVRLPNPAATGDTIRTTLAFTSEQKSEVIFPSNQPGAPWQPSYWLNVPDPFPTLSSTEPLPETPPGWSLTVTVPADYRVVSTGWLAADRKTSGGRHTFQWRHDQPTSLGLIFTVGRLGVARDTWTAPDGRRVPVEVYSFDDAETRHAALRRLMRTIDLYSRLLMPYPEEGYRMVKTPEDVEGSAEAHLTYTDVGKMDHPALYPLHPASATGVFMHEMAHDWLGRGAVPMEGRWLNEGASTFMAAEYWNAEEGLRGEQEVVYFYGSHITGPARGSDQLPLSSGGMNIYGRGPKVLYMLKRYLGEPRFWRAMQSYLTRYVPKHGVSNEALRKGIQDATGEDLTWFFDQWVFSFGKPEFVVAAQYDSTTQRVTLQVRQVQDTTTVDVPEGELQVDTVAMQVFQAKRRAQMPPVFRMPVTVRIATRKGDVLGKAQLTDRTQTIVIEHVSSAPTMIVFDDTDGIYKDLIFDQPTSWLAAQLKREPTLWQTWWAIDQLGARASRDTTAAAALVTAARGARYPVTRAQAVSSLGKNPTPGGLAAVRNALRDSAAEVRQAAILALGAWPAHNAVPLLRRAFATDRVDHLRATSLRVAMQLKDWTDPSARRALLTRGLRTASLQDVIRSAALNTVSAESCDSTLVPLVEPLIELNPAAVAAAYTLSATCPPFKALLERHRNDPRLHVRWWIHRLESENDAQ